MCMALFRYGGGGGDTTMREHVSVGERGRRSWGGFVLVSLSGVSSWFLHGSGRGVAISHCFVVYLHWKYFVARACALVLKRAEPQDWFGMH
ncbi:hypothetical protein VTH06DRAFT_2846 [Thermothelomyces fergusii]